MHASSRPTFERGKSALVAFDRDHVARTKRQQGARQPAGTGTDLDHRCIFKRTCSARDPRGQIEVEEEVLAERFARRQGVLADDLAKRREIIYRAHAGRIAAMRAASRRAAIKLDGFAFPLPAMSNAVP